MSGFNFSFNFSGQIPASKSVLNRALVIASFYRPGHGSAPGDPLRINGDSSCDDVQLMRSGLSILSRQPEAPRGAVTQISVGVSGAVFRFLALRVSREPGEYFISAGPELLRRPQQELLGVLGALGVRCEVNPSGLHLWSSGWKAPQSPLKMDSQVSSQFMSALLLSAWDLDFELQLEYDFKNALSSSYFKLTLEMLTKAGMRVAAQDGRVRVPVHQRVLIHEITAELDMSTAFVISAFGALLGQARILNFSEITAQADFRFKDLLAQMGVPIQVNQGVLLVKKGSVLKSMTVNLRDAPDLFPVLSVMCAFADGRSKLSGARQLKYKESDRILKTAELLTLAGVTVRLLDDGLEIEGGINAIKGGAVDFDPANDHRMAMAAALLSRALADCGSGPRITILDPGCVSKSYPEFWSAIS